ALEIMKDLATKYVANDFPNHKVWTVAFSDETIAQELRALGLLTSLGSRGKYGNEWRLSDAGQQWVMANRRTPSVVPMAERSISDEERFESASEDWNQSTSRDAAWTRGKGPPDRAKSGMNGREYVLRDTADRELAAYEIRA